MSACALGVQEPATPAHPWAAALQADFPEQRLVLDGGLQVAWRQAGDAASDHAVVLLHGISSGAASWLGVAQALRPRCRVLAWEAPGYGASTPLAGDAPRDTEYAAALAASLQALGVRRCLLVGHSLGALMAAALARALPAGLVVEQLVLISPAGGYGGPDQQAYQAAVRQGRRAALAAQGVAGLAAAIDQRLLSAQADGTARAWVRWNTARLHAAGYLQAVELLCRSDLGQAAGNLSMPVQVWVGEADVVTPPAACAAWASRLGAGCVTLAQAGHASPVEQASVVAQRLAALLNRTPA